MSVLDKVFEDHVHELLEGSWGVVESKEHNKGFIES